MGARVLVVEDDDDNRSILVKLLSLEGYEVAEAADGGDALEKARSWRPHLVLMDLALPRLDGWETARRMKADAELSAIPIVALTALAMQGDEEGARAAGCDDYLPKPARPAAIRSVVHKHLDPKQ